MRYQFVAPGLIRFAYKSSYTNERHAVVIINTKVYV